MESLLRVPEVPSGSGKARKGRKTPTDKHERRAADPAAWRTIMAQLHGRRVEVDAMKPMQHIPAVKPSCASSPTPPPPSPSPQVYLTHMHINMQHTLSCSSAPPATAPCAAPRRAALLSPFSFSPLQPRSLTISGMVLSSRWISSRPDTTFCPWPLPRVCDADDEGDDWGLLSCHR